MYCHKRQSSMFLGTKAFDASWDTSAYTCNKFVRQMVKALTDELDLISESSHKVLKALRFLCLLRDNGD